MKTWIDAVVLVVFVVLGAYVAWIPLSIVNAGARVEPAWAAGVMGVAAIVPLGVAVAGIARLLRSQDPRACLWISSVSWAALAGMELFVEGDSLMVFEWGVLGAALFGLVWSAGRHRFAS